MQQLFHTGKQSRERQQKDVLWSGLELEVTSCLIPQDWLSIVCDKFPDYPWSGRQEEEIIHFLYPSFVKISPPRGVNFASLLDFACVGTECGASTSHASDQREASGEDRHMVHIWGETLPDYTGIKSETTQNSACWNKR